MTLDWDRVWKDLSEEGTFEQMFVLGAYRIRFTELCLGKAPR